MSTWKYDEREMIDLWHFYKKNCEHIFNNEASKFVILLENIFDQYEPLLFIEFNAQP